MRLGDRLEDPPDHRGLDWGRRFLGRGEEGDDLGEEGADPVGQFTGAAEEGDYGT